MYCVKCGVRLQDGVSACPLCLTPVWNPDSEASEPGRNYPDNLPQRYQESRLPALFIITILAVTVIVVTLAICLRLYGRVSWSGYVAGGVVLFYVAAVLPAWFRRPKGEVFVPVAHAAAALYVLYICLATGGHWFMSFAFPVILAGCLLATAMICLLKYVKSGRIFIFGGFFILFGGFTVLVEFFEHISFGTQMFLWSLFPLAGFGAAGLLLIIAGIIPPLRQAFAKRFFF
ncbi:MAG: hypothetical protein IJJ22_00460 [Oscillospiraceae bacterium]|nr:hypothetical protein [Oscillospiraceae bacterium]